MLALSETERVEMPQVCLPFATNAKGERWRQRRWRAVWATIDKVCVKVDRKGRDCSRGGGETTELCLPHRGVRAHDASMDKDAGVGAGAAFPDGDGVSTGCWARESAKFSPIARRVLKERHHEVPG